MIHPYWYSHCHFKISSKDIPTSLAFINLKLKELVPEYPFELKFFEEDIDRLYRTEQRIINLVRYGTILAVFVACLGLFGLACFAAEQRTKEIGIRKVLGASVSGIVFQFSKEFAKWVLLANVIAWPLSYFFMRKWLQGFAYRTPMEWEVFALSGLLALGIALITVSSQALKSAMVNPVKSLRYE
jgi:putative ABC transport system permease protein